MIEPSSEDYRRRERLVCETKIRYLDFLEGWYVIEPSSEDYSKRERLVCEIKLRYLDYLDEWYVNLSNGCTTLKI